MVLLGGLVGCSDPGTATFPPGTGEPDAAQPETEPGIEDTDAGETDADAKPPPPPAPPGDASPDTTATLEAGDAPDATAQDAQDAPADAGADVLDATPGQDAAPEAALNQPVVFILSPEDGAVVHNPVTFQIASRNVAYVQLYADQYALSGPWDPWVDDTFEYTFLGLDYEREIRLVGLDVYQNELAEDTITITVVE